jgi:molybdenum cofactor synthesis domain-containing protein
MREEKAAHLLKEWELNFMWIPKKFAYTSLREAHQLIREITRGKAKHEVVPVFHAYNRVLAEDIISDVDIPPVSISHFDGYAVRAEDSFQASINNPILLRVVGRIYPNEEYSGEVNVWEAAYISTGCSLPAGANAVIPVELAKNKGDFIEVRQRVKPYENVIPAGADVKKGQTIFKVGHVLRAQDIKFLVDIKKWRVKVFKKPVVAIASVGSELTSRIEETDEKKFNSHGEMISILVGEAGGVPLNLGIAPDDLNAIKRLLREGLEEADIVVTVGGASVGEKDYVLEAVNQLGISKVLVRGIRVQPGRVTSLSVAEGKPIVMLPGHVQSTLVGFYLILLPLIRQMSGLASPFPFMALKARMSRKILLKGFVSFERVRFVNVTEAASSYIAEPIIGDSSLTSVVAKANGFIIIPEWKEVIEEGEDVNVHLVNGLFPLI